jgi:hypothetical protein
MTKLYITRFEHNRANGWWVRVPGHPCKLFSDRPHGGKKLALQAATEYRNQLCPTPKRHIRSTPRKSHVRNTSGKIGVSKIVERGKHVGWRVFWNHPTHLQKSFCLRFKQFGIKAHTLASRLRDTLEEVLDNKIND